MLGFNNMSTLVGHFVWSPREREERDRRDSRGDEREGQGRKRDRNESEETEEIKKILPLPLPATRIAGSAQTVSQYHLDTLLMQDTRHLCHTDHPNIVG